MIRSGEKKEEYREIKHYYTVRFRNLMTYAPWSDWYTVSAIMAASRGEGVPVKVILRGGYSALSPAIQVSGKLLIGEGKPEWGAEPGKDYYIIRIEGFEDLLTDWKSYARDDDKLFQLIDCQEEENKGANNTGYNTADNTGGNE